MTEAKRVIIEACKQFEKQQKEDKTALTFEHDGKSVEVPKSLVDLVMNLNPKDSNKRAAITEEIFKNKA